MADFSPAANPFLPRRPATAAPMLPSTTGPNRAALGSVLREEEDPSVFESLFRFLGRPSFVVRNLLTGNLQGAARNSLQFGQEFMVPVGILNPRLNPANLLFGVKDFSREKDRPEFSDVLREWGVVKNRRSLNGWEKFAVDIVGGVITDPLVLAGGGGKIAGLTAKDLAVGSADDVGRKVAERVVAGGGRALNAAKDQKLATYLHVYTGRLARRAAERGTGAAAARQAAGQVTPRLDDAVRAFEASGAARPNLPDALRAFHATAAPGPMGIVGPQRAAAALRTLENKAGHDLILDVLKDAGVDVSRGRGFVPGSFRGPLAQADTAEAIAAASGNVLDANGVIVVARGQAADPLVSGWRQGRDVVHELHSTFGPNPEKFFSVVPRGSTLPDVADVARGVQSGAIRRAPLPFLDDTLDVLYSSDNQIMANRVMHNLEQASNALSPFRRGVVGPAPPANFRPAGHLHRALSAFRDLGYDDAFTQRLLTEQFGDAFPAEVNALLTSTDEVIRLGNTVPTSIPGQAIKALMERGMAPGGGFSFSPLWSDTLGKAGERLTGWTYRSTFNPKTGAESAGFVFVPWGSLGKMTLPGMISSMAHEMNWKGPLFVEKQLGRAADWMTRKLYDKFTFGKHAFANSEVYGRAADAMEHAVRKLKVGYEAAVNRLPIAVREAMSGLGDGQEGREVAETVTRVQHQKEQDYHRVLHAMWRERTRAPRPPGQPGPASALFERDTLLPALREMARPENAESPLANIRTGHRHARRLLDNIEQEDAAAAAARADVAAADAALQTLLNNPTARTAANAMTHARGWQARAQAALATVEAPFQEQFRDLLEENAQRMFVGMLTKEMIDEVAHIHPNVPRQAIENAVRYSHEEMRKVAAYMRYGAKNSGDLVHAATPLSPAWPTIEQANPFYLPHQLDPRLVEALGRRDLTPKQVSSLQSVFDKRREYETIDQFIEEATRIADDLGIDSSDVTEIVQSDYRALTLQRLLAFERTKFANEAHQAAVRIAGHLGGPLSVYEDYLAGALHGVDPRSRNPILKFMSGGPLSFEVSQPMDKAIDFMNRSFDHTSFVTQRQLAHGRYRITLNWPGLNSLYKPLLTSSPPGLRFRFRNNVSSPFQLMFHPDVGFVGLKAFLDVLRNDGLVRWGIRQFGGEGSWKAPLSSTAQALPDSTILAQMTDEQRVAWATQTFTRAITAPNEAERVLTRQGLEQFHDLKIGPYTFKEAFGILDAVAGPRMTTRADLTAGVDNLEEFLGLINKPMHHDPNLMGQFVRKFRKFVDFGQEMATESETQWRVLGALKFMEQGKSPVEIVSQVNRLFVDYSRNSELEGWLRGFIPFARFMIGSTGWLKDIVANPSGAGKGLVGRFGSMQGLGTVSRALTSPGTDGTEASPMVPSYVKETLALPLPWLDKEGNQAFLVSLGFPHEVVVNMLSLVSGRPESIRRVALGSLQPAVKTPLEAMLGRTFYFGTEFGSYRKAPWWAEHTIATEVPGPDGTTRYEVPGTLNEVLNAFPTAGMESTLNRLSDDRRSIAGRLVNAMTGFQVQSVDQEAELQRRISDYLREQVRSGAVGELKVFFERLRPEDVPEDVRMVLDQLEKIRAEKHRKKERK